MSKQQKNKKRKAVCPKVRPINKVPVNDFPTSYVGGFDSFGPTFFVWYALDDANLSEMPRTDEMDLRRTTMAELKEEVGDDIITHLCIRGDPPDSLDTVAPHVTNMLVENINAFPPVLGKFKSLQTLHINDSKFPNGIPDYISDLSNLSVFRITRSELSSLPSSLKNMVGLKTLDLSESWFEDALPACIFELTSVTDLQLNKCHLRSLPSLKFMTSLKKLDISYNEFENGSPPPVLAELSELEDLNLASCNLHSFPDSFRALESLLSLDLSDNDFSKGLPSGIAKIHSLKTLRLVNCNVDDLPGSLSQLKNLEILSLGMNKFENLPSVVCSFKELRVLSLGSVQSNEVLKNLDQNLTNLTKLSTIDCRRCEALNSPPFAVCEQGKRAIFKFYNDLKKGKVKVIAGTVAVIGELMSGKTSLVRSLKEKRRMFTTRCISSEKDDTTQVFEFNKLDLKDCSLRFVDFGGHQVYHMAYQMALKDHCIPLIVVNMEQYLTELEFDEPEKATQKVCFDWLSHLYLDCPRLKRPLLVLTHKDKFENDSRSFESLKEQLLENVEALRTKFLDEQELLDLPEDFQKIDYFENTSRRLFAPSDIFELGDSPDDLPKLSQLTESLEQYCQEFSGFIPKWWQEVGDFIEKNKDKAFLTFFDLERKYSEADELDVIVRYLRNIGRILWYEDHDSLKNFIFHRITAVTDMVKLLFHHSGYHEWYQMAKKFKGVRFDGKVMDKKDYHHLIDNFRTNGILDIFVLKQIFDHESAFGYNVAMEVLQAFFLVHGPVDSHPRPQFILPYFSPELKDDSYKKADDRLQLRVEILFKGLALPRYVHQLLTVAMFNTLNDAEEKYYKWSYANGATIEHGECSFHLVHDFKKHSLILQVTTPVSQVSQSWKKLAITCKKVVCCAKKCGKATRPEVNLFCCHCIYVRAEEPGYQLMKDWAYFNEDEIDYVRTKSYTQAKCFKENNKEGNLDVPLPLLEPCKELNENHVKQLMEYLEKVKRLPSKCEGQASTVTAVQASNDDDGGFSDDDEFMDERNDHLTIMEPHIYMKPCTSPDVRQLFNQSDRVYQMSQPCRGRCLIINNYNFDPPRLGSDVDMQNIENVFTALSFDCTPHQDLTAQEMKDAIHRETQDEEHGCYGMFVLVIMTHGDQSTVCGIDGISVQRKEILDLLSNFKFTKMAGRPKLVVIQACSGVSEDRMNQPLLHDNRIDARAENGGELLQPEDEGLEPGDLPPPLIPLPGEIPSYQGIYLLNSSAPGFVSYRHPNFGSFFIRATVSTLYKHSCHKHVEDLSKQIQHKINKQREKYQQRGIRVGSQLVTYSNWLEPSKTLYLFSGFNPSM